MKCTLQAAGVLNQNEAQLLSVCRHVL